jgi:hypothetical protein
MSQDNLRNSSRLILEECILIYIYYSGNQFTGKYSPKICYSKLGSDLVSFRQNCKLSILSYLSIYIFYISISISISIPLITSISIPLYYLVNLLYLSISLYLYLFEVWENPRLHFWLYYYLAVPRALGRTRIANEELQKQATARGAVQPSLPSTPAMPPVTLGFRR